MKRFAVLCSIVALVSLYVPSSWATAPSIADLPDVRLSAPGGSVLLNQQEMDAYNLEDFIKDFDQTIGELTIGLDGAATWVVPPSDLVTPDGTNPATEPTIEIPGDNLVDIYSASGTGWALYRVEVDDGTPANLAHETAIAKYSTFAMGTPTSLSAGRFFDLDPAGWQLGNVWMEDAGDVVINDLDSTIDPPTAVTWSAYVNYATPEFDLNGNLLGLDPVYVDHASEGVPFTALGWDVTISTAGGLTVAPAGSVFSPGPLLIGILATNDLDEQDADAARVLVSAGLIGLATPGEGEAPSSGKSETLDDLAEGLIETPTSIPADMPAPIAPGSHWVYWLQNSDSIHAGNQCQLEIKDLATDTDLPPAAIPKGVIGGAAVPMAGGNALKATLIPTGTVPSAGFRLISRAITGCLPGDVYTFSMNIATDVDDATNIPSMQMAMLNPLGASAAGFVLHRLAYPGVAGVEGTVMESFKQDIIPLATDGWQTLSANWSPPLTRSWGGGFAAPTDVFNDDDIAVIDAYFSSLENFTNDLQAVRASLYVYERRPTFAAGTEMTDTVHLWMDNLRIYRSAYELDLGYAKTEYVDAVPNLSDYIPVSLLLIPEPTGPIDGTFSASDTDLDAMGFGVDEFGTELAGLPRRTPYGPLPADAQYNSVSASQVTVNTSVDHTKAGGITNCLQVALPSTGDSAYRAFKAQIVSSVVATPEGSGIYCMEMYVSKARTTNVNADDKTPIYKLLLNQVAPNALATPYGVQFTRGGLPDNVGLEENNWIRVVGTGYIPDCQLLRVMIQVEESFTEDSSNYDVPSYFDDIGIYRVDDPAKFFDADLFDSI
jgi:hypothetical protein